MSLKETYLGNAENVKKMNPGAVIINVTRGAGSVLGPSWDLLNDWRARRITWDEYVRRYVEEMGNSKCRAEMLRIGELAKTRDVYMVCFERVGNCHRFLLVDMIRSAMLNAGSEGMRVLAERRQTVKISHARAAIAPGAEV